MAQPTPYDRQYSFQQYQALHPSDPLPGDEVDAEFDAVKASLDETQANLALIQRDDGALANGSVTTDSLNANVLALLGAGAGVPRGVWVTATVYAAKDIVTEASVTYICATAHTAGVFATDLAAGKWLVFATSVDLSGAVADAVAAVQAIYPGRNRIINGDMRIDQRNAGASVTPTTSQYLLDRWGVTITQASKFSAQQNAGAVTPPAGSAYYLGFTSLASTTPGSTDQYTLKQPIEGLNVADLNWGSAAAKSVTLSFKVYSSLTGTFAGAVQNSAADRSYPFTYSIPLANAWTTVSVTIPGDTSGTWFTTSGIGVNVLLSLGAGSTFKGTAGAWAGSNITSVTGAVDFVGTNTAKFYITAVQFEVGSVATPFELVDYSTMLQRCQRRCYVWAATAAYDVVGLARQNASGASVAYLKFPQKLAKTATLSTSGNFGFGQEAGDGLSNQGAAVTLVAPSYGALQSTEGAYLSCASSGVSTGTIGYLMAYNDATAKLKFEAEL